MDAKASAKPITRAKELQINAQKWTKPLMDAGWTVMPTVIFERQKALGLDALDVNILLHLAGYWWTPDNKPHPSKRTIAAAIGALEPHGVDGDFPRGGDDDFNCWFHCCLVSERRTRLN